MNKLSIAILLTTLPIISFLLQYYFAARRKKLDLFNKFKPVKVLDWVFIPFNFLLVYVVSFNVKLSILLLMAVLIIDGIFSQIWLKIHKKEKNEFSLYDLKKGKMTAEGYVHKIYGNLQAVLVGLFIFSSIKNTFVYVELFLLTLYLLGGIYSSISIHGKWIKADKIFILAGLAIMIVKLIYTI